MAKSYKKNAEQRRKEQVEFLRHLDGLYGKHQLQRDVFGRRVALPSEIARQLQLCPVQGSPH